MKFIGFCLFLFSVIHSFGQSKDTVALSKIVKEICVKIERNDFEGLKQMIKFGDFFTEQIFENMKNVHSKNDYRKLYYTSQLGPIYEAEKYILGGHGDATRHVNIELRYVNKKWQLYKIWVCR